MRLLSLGQLIAEYVKDGQALALEGFTHLIPFAAAHEIIRLRRRGLRLIRITPDLVYDQMIGAGCAIRLTFSWGGNPGAGSLHRLRDAVEHDWPHPLVLNEHSHAGMASAYVAGASNLPFAVLRGYMGTDLMNVNSEIRTVRCPYTGEELATVPALRPDVTILHAQQADRAGNVLLRGIVGAQKEAALAARVTLVTVEEIVEHFDPCFHGVLLPHWVVTAIACVPGGAYPSYAQGYYRRDNAFYLRWPEISRDRESFVQWLDRYVFSSRDHQDFLRSIGAFSLAGGSWA